MATDRLTAQPYQFTLEGINDDGGVPTRDMSVRNAFGRVVFPEYFGIDQSNFVDISPDALHESDPLTLENKLYAETDLSMRETRMRDAGWIVLNAFEHTTIIEYPERLAQVVSKRNLTSQAASMKGQDKRNRASARAGAHSLEPKIDPMERLATGYHTELATLRELRKEIPYHWQAHKNEGRMRVLAESVRTSLHNTLQIVADAEQWSEVDLRLAKIGLDMRLTAGSGQEDMDDKKQSWIDLTKVRGNYVRTKKILVRDRLLRSKYQIDTRLSQNQEV